MPYWGGLRPLVPLAHAVRTAGHRVAVAAPTSFSPTIGRHRLEALAAGMDDVPEELDRMFADLHRSQADPWTWTFDTWVGGLCCQYMATDLITIADAWKPDLIVREASEYGGCLAAEALGIPHASVRPRPAHSRLSYERRAGVAAVLSRRRAELELPSDPENEMPHRYLELAFLPSRFFGGAEVYSDRTHFVNFGLDGLDLDPAAEVDLGRGDRQSVYVSLGSLQYSAPGVMEAIIGALRQEPVDVTVSAGDEQAVARLQRLAADGRATIAVNAWVDQLAALRSSDVFVTHAGINSVREALTLGVPMVVVPICDDQPFNAERCVALGVARRVERGDRQGDQIAEAVQSVLRGSVYRDSSIRFQRAIGSLPPVSRAVALLEQLAETGRPIPVARRVATPRRGPARERRAGS